MKDTLWKLFKQTGNPAYYSLYKRLQQTNGSDDTSNHLEGN
ncbi:MAG: YqzL family protein [Clostridia bacterium]|nr:YqzL family protein [Clostridia bacterium]